MYTLCSPNGDHVARTTVERVESTISKWGYEYHTKCTSSLWKGFQFVFKYKKLLYLCQKFDENCVELHHRRGRDVRFRSLATPLLLLPHSVGIVSPNQMVVFHSINEPDHLD